MLHFELAYIILGNSICITLINSILLSGIRVKQHNRKDVMLIRTLLMLVNEPQVLQYK